MGSAAARIRRSGVLPGLLLFGLAVAAYANNFGGRFYGDDYHHIVNNPALRDIEQIPRLFVDPFTFSAGRVSGGFRPLVLATFTLNFLISGHDTWSYHLFNNLLHAVNVVLVYWLLLWLLRIRPRADAPTADPHSRLTAFSLALVFALHPIQGEAVNYINARSNLMATLFYLAATLVLVGWRTGRSRRTTLACGLVVLLGLLSAASKEIGFTLFVNLSVLDLVVLRRTATGSAWRGLAVHLPLALSLIGLWYVRSALLAAHAIELPPGPASLIPLRTYLLTQVGVVVGYLRSILLPLDLAFLRHFAEIESPFDPRFLVPAAVLAALVSLALVAARRAPLVAAGLAWFAIALSPTSVHVMQILSAERRCYLGLVGVVIALAGGMAWLGERGFRGAALRRGAAVSLCVVALAAYLPATWARNALWADGARLLDDSTRKGPRHAQAWLVYAEELLLQKQLDRARQAARTALELDPGSPSGHHVLGRVHLASGRLDEAVEEIRESLRIRDRPFPNSGTAYRDLGRVYLEQGRLEQAEPIFTRFLTDHPTDAVSLAGMGRIAASRGDDAKAIEFYRRATAMKPGAFEPRIELALALHRTGELSEARALYRSLLSELPDDPVLLYNLALVQKAQSDFRSAARNLETVVARQPDNFQALVHLAELLEGPLDRPEQAVPFYFQARPLCADDGCAREIDRRISLLSER